MSTSWPGGIISKTAIVPTGPLETGAASGMWTLDQAAAYTKQGIWPLAGNAPVIDTLFSAYTYTGNGSTQTITNGIDLAGKGGLTWLKGRSGATNHALYDTTRTATNDLVTNSTAAATTQATGLTTFSSTGFSIGALAKVNTNAATYVGWSFAQGTKFFKMAQVVVSGSDQTVDLSSLGTVGMVTVKRTDSTSDWYTWHRSLTAGNLVYLNTTAAQAASAAISVSGTTLTLTQATIGNGTYIVYAWAHDTSAGGMIQCGSYADGVSAVTLGWEPQYFLVKDISSAGTPWGIFDTSRQFSNTNNAELDANSSGAEAVIGSAIFIPTATGFNQTGGAWGAGNTLIYMAIRRPMKVPTLGTQVFTPVAYTGNGTTPRLLTGAGFAPDLSITAARNSILDKVFYDRLRGKGIALFSTLSTGETTRGGVSGTMVQDGITLDNTNDNYNGPATTYINWFFKRAPRVFDEVCYTGTGTNTTQAHELGVVPELMLIKGRSGATAWAVYASGIANTEYLVLNTTAAKATGATYWNSTSPTSTVFSVGSGGDVNTNGATYAAYLFATLAGVSKVGSYTGNGSSLTIDAGFTTGARFILIKRTDSTGDWFTWDSTRGIVAGNDPHLSLNTSATEVTTDDSIDPDNSGFIVNQVAATNINVTSATYIYLAFA